MKKRIWIGVSVAIVIPVGIAVAVTLVFVLKSDAPTVETKSGKVKGSTSQTSDGSTIHEFFNIPYATPPVGVNRFQPPKVKNAENPWDGTVDASTDKDIKCVQSDSGEGTEDCLVMTIRAANLTSTKPVIVWIHGGGVVVGYGNQPGYSFDANMTKELDAVTVNINYRLALLGFNSIADLWDEDAGVYANNGIRDQIAALEWIQDNIAGFGGDPNSVTIIGESGGATSVLAIISSSLANDKYHRAIALSPAPEMRLDYIQGNDFQQNVYDINIALGCNQSTKADRKECLMETPAEYFSIKGDDLPGKLGFGDIATAHFEFGAYFDFPLRYGEIWEYSGMILTDPSVVQQSPRNLANGSATPRSKVKVIISNTAEENGIMQLQGVNVFNDTETLNETLTTCYAKVTNDSEILDKTYTMYPDMYPQEIWDTLTTDMRATCPTNDVAIAMSLSDNHDIYRLYITNAPSPVGMPSFHIWDTVALFGFTLFGEAGLAVTEKDLQFRESLMGILKSFAEDGSLPDGWDTFPGKTMTLTDSIDEMEVISNEKPQQEICEKLRELDLVKYGWQE